MTTAVADARWALLRAALSGQECCESVKKASIHRFVGWNLLAKQQITADPVVPDLRFTNDVDDILYKILACQCHSNGRGSVNLHCLQPEMRDEEIADLREQLGRHGILARWDPSQSLIHVKWSYCSYVGMQYDLGGKHQTKLFARERLPRRKVSLRELMSHDLHQGVDNTGQTCVWDSESTLTYCLLNEESGLRRELPILSQLDDSYSIAELGVGMAGLAGMALAKVAPVQVLLTDGHPEAVANNRVNVKMNDFQGNVKCQQLLWSIDIDTHAQEFDVALGSDLTHFTEHHAGLVVTLAHVLKIGGTAVLCQPARADSLNCFLELCKSMEGLWSIRTITDETLNQKHKESQASTEYNADIHCPRIVLLEKLRNVCWKDRQLANELLCHH